MKEQFRRAEGFHELGMHEDAWNTLEELPPIDRVDPLVVELRLRILTALERWEMGQHLSNVLLGSMVEPEKCCRTVARFRHAYARNLIEAGLIAEGKEQIGLAVDAWEDIKNEIIADDGLEGFWWGGTNH